MILYQVPEYRQFVAYIDDHISPPCSAVEMGCLHNLAILSEYFKQQMIENDIPYSCLNDAPRSFDPQKEIDQFFTRKWLSVKGFMVLDIDPIKGLSQYIPDLDLEHLWLMHLSDRCEDQNYHAYAEIPTGKDKGKDWMEALGELTFTFIGKSSPRQLSLLVYHYEHPESPIKLTEKLKVIWSEEELQRIREVI